MNIQTWWDKNLLERFDEFKNWVGDKNADTKILCRNIVKLNNMKSLVDFGCGLSVDYFAYKEDNYDINYMGIDSSNFIYEKNINMGIPMTKEDVRKTSIEEKSYDVCYSRHVLEHQSEFKTMLNEMIRVAKKMVINVFFIIPGDIEKIDYNSIENLYHNLYSKIDIETFLKNNEKVKNWEWIKEKNEEILLINLI